MNSRTPDCIMAISLPRRGLHASVLQVAYRPGPVRHDPPNRIACVSAVACALPAMLLYLVFVAIALSALVGSLVLMAALDRGSARSPARGEAGTVQRVTAR